MCLANVFGRWHIQAAGGGIHVAAGVCAGSPLPEVVP